MINAKITIDDAEVRLAVCEYLERHYQMAVTPGQLVPQVTATGTYDEQETTMDGYTVDITNQLSFQSSKSKERRINE